MSQRNSTFLPDAEKEVPAKEEEHLAEDTRARARRRVKVAVGKWPLRVVRFATATLYVRQVSGGGAVGEEEESSKSNSYHSPHESDDYRHRSHRNTR